MTDPATRINAERLWGRHLRLARYGALANGGVNRQALSAEERAAWNEVIGWARALGLAPFTDPAGNLFLCLKGIDAEAAPALTDRISTVSPRAASSTAYTASWRDSRPLRL